MRGVGRGGRLGGISSPFDDAPRRPIMPGTLRRVVNLYRPYRFQLSLVVVMLLLAAGMSVIPALLVARLIDDALPAGDRGLIAQLAGTMLGITALAGILNLGQAYLNTHVGFGVMRALRARVYAHLQKLPLSFFTSTRTGEIQSRLSNDVSNTQLVLTDTLGTVVSNLAVVISSIAAMILISWQLSLVALCIVPIFGVFTVRVGRRRRKLTGETQRALGELTARTGETLSVSGVLLAKTFGREQEQIRRFDQDNSKLTELSIRQQMTGRGFFVTVQTFFGMAPAIVWWLGGYLISGGSETVTIGDIVAFTTIQVRLLFPLAGLLNRGVDVTSSLALFDRIFEYMDLQPEIQDPADPVRMHPARIRGEIEFRSVRFAYPSARDNRSDGKFEEFALNGVSFTAPASGLTALVGPSGAGKTTIGYLVSRLYDVQSGSVKIDGVDVRDVTQRDLNRIIGVVTQDTFLFHASIRENLLYGNPSASQDEVEAAARAAQIHELIDSLPERYETGVGERGYRMSGGERQRIAIARVILADPRVLLLDEATSSLDSLSERLIQQALSRLMRGRTTIAIAHRLSTVIAADQILVIDGGKVVDRGRHEELIGRSDLYRRLNREQFAALAHPEPGSAVPG